MDIRTDLRRLDMGEEGDSIQRFDAAVSALREAWIVAALALREVDRSRSFRREGFASPVDLAVSRKLDRRAALELLQTAMACEMTPLAESSLREARVSPADVARVGSLRRHGERIAAAERERLVSEAQEAGEPDVATQSTEEILTSLATALLHLAVDEGPAALRRAVRARIESAVQREHVVHLALCVSESAARRFRRARVLVSRAAGRSVTEGEAFARVVDSYLEQNDDLWKETAPRRVGPTADRPEDRYVPAEERRAVVLRSGDRCEVPGCGNRIFTQVAHLRAHARGGDRERGNLCALCRPHHTMYDAGYMRVLGRDASGLTIVFTMTGVVRSPADDDIGREVDSGPARAGGDGEASGPGTKPPETGGSLLRERPPPWGRAAEVADSSSPRHQAISGHRGGFAPRRRRSRSA